MNILVLAPVHREREFLKQNGKYPFLIGQGQQSWVEALVRLGHEVFVFRYTDSILIPQGLRVWVSEILQKFIPMWKARYERFRSTYYFISLENYFKNKKLLSLSQKIKPQLIIISGGVTSIYPCTIEMIKEKFACKILLFSGINPLTSSAPVEKIMVKKGIIDMVVENDRGYSNLWKNIGAKKTIVLPISSVDSKLHRKVELTQKERKEYGCDVCFVGSLTKDRQKKLANLTQFNLKIWGDLSLTIGLIKELRPFYHGIAFGEKMVKIFNAAKIVLNFQPKDMTHGGNMRTFEIPGCGAFQIADKVDPDFLTSDEEVMLFKNISDLKGKIKYYLQKDKERLKIAKNGFLKSHKLHTYQKHFEILFNLINDKR